MLKRALDILISAALFVVLALPFLCIACAIWVQDWGPVLYRQVRVGRGGRLFRILKFRTMVVNADKKGGFQTFENDARITRLGSFLRKTSIDELPQLLNVLVGDMALVGPRPDVPDQESMYAPEDWRLRHTVRPGITGLAQASGRSSIDFETRTRYDLDYISRASFALDLKIMWQTVANFRKGV